jgi:3-dehydroquinate synthase
VKAVPVPVREVRDASYEVLVGRGALAELPRILDERCRAGRYAVVADRHVAELHGSRLTQLLAAADIAALLVHFPAGEWNKTRESWAEITDALLKARVGRDGAIIALGGGVAGDLAGFVAATYLRGIPYVQVPTTLLAMIDASVGGKTGVDVPAGKNLVGAFHQPAAVVADVELLATLPRIQLAAGMAEAIKHGLIADAGYFAALEDAGPVLAKDLGRLEAIVTRSVEIKAAIVSADEREAGLRAVLNFGHTVGHAIEALSGFELLHGEATAIGMAVEARIAEDGDIAELGLADAIVPMLQRYALPTTVRGALTTDALLEVMAGDKKARSGRVRLALPRCVGQMAQSHDGAWTHDVDEGVIRQVLDISR